MGNLAVAVAVTSVPFWFIALVIWADRRDQRAEEDA